MSKRFDIKDKTGLLLRLLASWLLARCVLFFMNKHHPFHMLMSTRYVNVWVLSALLFGFFLLLHFTKKKLQQDTDVFFFFYSLHLCSFGSIWQYREKSFAMGILFLNLIFFYALMPLLKKADIHRRFKVILAITSIPTIGFSLGLSLTLKEDSQKFQYTLILALISLIIASIFMMVYKKVQVNKPDFIIPVERITVTSVVLYALALCTILVIRYVNLDTPTYDFGIFAQMFHYMKETGHPLTTLERNGLLSHFHVHLSPVYYLMLPFYLIWPNPAMLQLVQVLVLMSGILPFVLLAKEFQIPQHRIPIFVVMYVFNPGLTGGLMYDLHENCFLAPLLLWVLYFLQKDNHLGVAVFSFLVLCVKEDAAVYLACIGLYAAFSQGTKKRKQAGIILFASSLLWFTGALLYLENFGRGAMIGRYKNMIIDRKAGLLGIFSTIYKNPGYVLSEIFTMDKLIYFLTMLVPLGFLSLLNRKLSYWFLIVPFVVINLLTDYPYQYNIGYQYHFGSGVLLLYTVLLFVRDNFPVHGNIKSKSHPIFTYLVFVALVGSVIFGLNIVSGRMSDVKDFINDHEEARTVKSALDVIPEDASLQATTFLTSYLSDREILYDVKYNQNDENPHITDFAVFDLRGNRELEFQDIISNFKNEGYETWLYVHDHVMILKNAGYKKPEI